MEIINTYSYNDILEINKAKWRLTYKPVLTAALAFLICILYFLLLNKFKINDEVDGTFDGIVIVSDLGLWWILLSSWRRTISTSKKFIDKYSNEKSNIEVILKDSEIIYSSVEINSVYK